jgi:hypothetical protein
MHHILTRETAYARLIVAIVTDDSVRGRNRTDAVDALVQRFIDTDPSNQVCHAHTFTFAYCEACAAVA